MTVFPTNFAMKRKTQIRLALLLIASVATIGDLILRELPNKILAELNHPGAHRTPTRLVLAEMTSPLSR